MSDDSSFHDRVRKAADSATLTLLARLASVAIMPLGGFIGAEVWAKLEKTAESTARLEEQFKSLIDRQLPDMNVRIEGRFNAQSDRITAHDRRIERIEDWRNQKGMP